MVSRVFGVLEKVVTKHCQIPGRTVWTDRLCRTSTGAPYTRDLFSSTDCHWATNLYRARNARHDQLGRDASIEIRHSSPIGSNAKRGRGSDFANSVPLSVMAHSEQVPYIMSSGLRSGARQRPRGARRRRSTSGFYPLGCGRR